MRDRHITCLSSCTSTVLAAAAVVAVAALSAAAPIAAAAAAKVPPAAAAGEAAAAPTATAVAAVAALPPAAAGRYGPNMSATGAGGTPQLQPGKDPVIRPVYLGLDGASWNGDPTSVSGRHGAGDGGAPGRLRVPPRCQDDLGALRLLRPPRPRPASRPAAPQLPSQPAGQPPPRPSTGHLDHRPAAPQALNWSPGPLNPSVWVGLKTRALRT